MTHANGHELPIISCRELRTIQDSGKKYLIIDVRDEADYEAGHVEESIHIPFMELEANIPNLVHDKKELVVVVGEQADQAQETWDHLGRAGFKHVRFLLGGFDEWCRPAAPTVDDILDDVPDDEKPDSHHEEESDSENNDEPLL